MKFASSLLRIKPSYQLSDSGLHWKEALRYPLIRVYRNLYVKTFNGFRNVLLDDGRRRLAILLLLVIRRCSIACTEQYIKPEYNPFIVLRTSQSEREEGSITLRSPPFAE